MATTFEQGPAMQQQQQQQLETVDIALYTKAKREIERLESTVNHQLKNISELKTALLDKDHQLSTISSKIGVLELTLEEKKQQIVQLDEQTNLLKEQEWLAQRSTAKMESEIASSRAYAVKMNQLLDESVKTAELIKKNNAELESTRRRCNHYRIVIEAMEKELRAARELTGEMKTLQDEVKTLKAIGIVKERENLQMKNALEMLEAWYDDYDSMAKHDFTEVRRRAIDGVAYPEGVDGDKYDQFFKRERMKREEEAAAKREKKHIVPGLHRRKTEDDKDSEDASGTNRRSGSQGQPSAVGQSIMPSYLDLGTIQADLNFNLIEHIRDLVSTEDNFLLDHIRVGLRVQIRLERVIIPGADSADIVSARTFVPVASLNRSRSTPRRALTARSAVASSPSNNQSSNATGDQGLSSNNNANVTTSDSFPHFDRIVSQAVEQKKIKQQLIGYSGIVRYIGLLDMPHPTTAVYAGIKLDDKVGYTNGTFLGKRYFFAPDGHGVFIRLVDITAVLNTKTYEYISLSRMFRKWKKTNNKKM